MFQNNNLNVLTQQYALKAALFVSLISFLVMLFIRGNLVLSESTDLAGIETNVIYSIQQLIDNGKLYTNPADLPFAITQYTPIYYYICASIAWLLDLDPQTDIYALYIVGRSLNLLFNIITGIFIFLIINRLLKVQLMISIVTALCSFVLFYRHDFSVRPDSLQDLFIIGSVYFFLRYLNISPATYHRIIYLFTVSLLSALAIFTKQSAIQMPLIIIAFLVFIKDWRGTILALVFNSLLFMTFAGIFNNLANGYFIQNVVGGVQNGINFSWFTRYILSMAFVIKILLPALVCLAVSYKILFFSSSNIKKFLCFCSCAMFGFATLTALKMGSSIQYYTVFQNVALIFIVFLIFNPQTDVKHSALSEAPDYKKASLILYICLLLLLNVSAQLLKLKSTEYDDKVSMLEQHDKVTKLVQYFQNEASLKSDEYIFADLHPNDRFGINNQLFRNCVAPQIDILIASTSPSKVFGYDELERCLTDGRIKYVIKSNNPRPTLKIKGFDNINLNRFTHVRDIGNYSILVYNE